MSDGQVIAARGLQQIGGCRARPAAPVRAASGRSAALSASAVFGPTTPSAVRPFACWKATTACSVAGPKLPSTFSEAEPTEFSACCSVFTSVPVSPDFSDPDGGSVSFVAVPVVGVVVVAGVVGVAGVVVCAGVVGSWSSSSAGSSCRRRRTRSAGSGRARRRARPPAISATAAPAPEDVGDRRRALAGVPCRRARPPAGARARQPSRAAPTSRDRRRASRRVDRLRRRPAYLTEPRPPGSPLQSP